MSTLFSEQMSLRQAQKVFYGYVAEHKGEDLGEVKKEYFDILKKIVARELEEENTQDTDK